VSAAITTAWRGHRINLIDTPGHIDFTAEVQRCLRVLDGAIVVFDAVHGVEPQSETVWHQANRYRVPRLCFINKMDRLGADFDRCVRSIHERLGAVVACLQLPMGVEAKFEGVIDLLTRQAVYWSDSEGSHLEYGAIPESYRQRAEAARMHLIEAIADTDEGVLSLYLEGKEPEVEQLRAALRRAALANRLFPVFCGAALRNIGIQPLLDGVVDYLPSPLDIGPVSGAHPERGDVLMRQPEEAEPFTALVFKVANDPYMGHLAYVRVYAGAIHAGQTVWNATRRQKERAGRLVRMYANHREDLERVHAGDIAALLGLNRVRTGDTLCDPAHPILLEPIAFPEPVINATVEPRAASDVDRMTDSLRRLTDEDPTLTVGTDEDTGQVLIGGMGELHLEIVLDRLQREYGVRARLGKPRITYKETITQRVPSVEGRFIRQTGGHGQYGHVALELHPSEPGSGIRFEVMGGIIPKQFIPAVELGVRDAAQNGVLRGYAVTDVVSRLIGGSHHPVDSSELAFRTAAAIAFRDGLRRGKPVLLEPIVRIEVIAPVEYTGAILGQLVARRAEIVGTEHLPGGVEAIRGMVPLAEMFGYVTELRSATQGRGLFNMEFDHYAPAPPFEQKV